MKNNIVKENTKLIIEQQYLNSVSVYTNSKNKTIKMHLLYHKPDTLIKRNPILLLLGLKFLEAFKTNIKYFFSKYNIKYFFSKYNIALLFASLFCMTVSQNCMFIDSDAR